MKKVVIGVGFWLALAAALAIFWSPSPVIHRVSGVYLIWFYGGLANLALAGVALASARTHSRWFWPAFLSSGVLWIVNGLIPLGLLAVLPGWTVLGVFVANLAPNIILGVPFRVMVWRIHTQGELLVQ